jgi:hypothetical protein
MPAPITCAPSTSWKRRGDLEEADRERDRRGIGRDVDQEQSYQGARRGKGMPIAITPMKATPSNQPVQPARPIAWRSPRPSARPTRTGHRLAKTERDHEVRAAICRATAWPATAAAPSQPHEIGGEREHAHFEPHGRPDRPAEPDDGHGGDRDRSATSGRTGWNRPNWRSSEATAISAPQ